MQTAFKEWTVVVDALEQGDQIVILRKGGIREGKAGFQVDSKSFWLFPTQFHQQRDAVIPPAQDRYDQIRRADDDNDSLSIRSFAMVERHFELENWEVISRLQSQHIWREEVIKERFEWGQKKGLFLMVVRVYRLASAIEMPMLKQYGGCRSWVELAPAMATDELTPVLDDESFEQQQKDLTALLV